MHNKKLKLGSLLLIGFLLTFLSLVELSSDKENNLIATTDNSLYKEIDASTLLSVLERNTGVILIINDRKDINRFMNILLDINVFNDLYLYNSKNDEIVLAEESGEITVKQSPTNDYEKLLNNLGSYTESYLIEDNEVIYETSYKVIPTPIVLFVKNGKIVFSYYLSSNEITDEQLKETYTIGFNKIND